jgi:acetyltransferase-like isoleucine patch superfamily enzyme
MDNQRKRIHETITDNSTSALQRYRRVVLGTGGLLALIKYEIITSLFGSFPGMLGLVLRRIFFPQVLGEVGRNPIFGRNIVIRHGHKIRLGDRVVIDDNVVLDAKGVDNEGITIGEDSFISRNCVLSCKGGNIRIGRNVSLGVNGLIHAEQGSDVSIGDNSSIAAFVYFVGGGNYRLDRLDIPIKEQGAYSKGGVVIGPGAWVGSHVQVLDGVKVGRDSILAAGAVVNRDVPDYAIVGGVPGRIIKSRLDTAVRTAEGAGR